MPRVSAMYIPCRPAALALTVAEALVGQLYIAILIASLVRMALRARSVEDERTGKSFYEDRRRLTSALQLDDAAADGDRYRMRAIVGAEFVHDVLDMGLDGVFRYQQFRGDIPIPVARCDLL